MMIRLVWSDLKNQFDFKEKQQQQLQDKSQMKERIKIKGSKRV